MHVKEETKVLPMERDSDLKNDSIHGVPFEQGLICDVLESNSIYHLFHLYIIVKYFTSTYIIKPIL